jgi:hypothetical protein
LVKNVESNMPTLGASVQGEWHTASLLASVTRLNLGPCPALLVRVWNAGSPIASRAWRC